MAAPSFAHVPEEGFKSFAQELSQGAWALIDTKPYAGPGDTKAKSLGDAPLLVTCKLRLTWVIAELVSARGGADSAQAADDAWDSAQRRGQSLLHAATLDPSPDRRAAATRLQKALMKGTGTAQTKLRYQQEVDYGRTQLSLANEPQNAADIDLLGLGGWLVEVEQATESLAEAIGYEQGTGRRPFQRRRAALSACSTNFVVVENELAWALRHGDEADHKRVSALLESLHGLARRYPPPAPAKPEA
ncbi:hypothetical protein [Polyangium spumosum]|uniref:Uncharacterized protein n=1 Tax=Polyangium spumosum TaxID=889282 RepID=A0A6N7PVR7_9BACT|nr:hypothetical protein [Polyangium spumosum]MRG96073.1 hypothetical protein [Polyangium spumosum]